MSNSKAENHFVGAINKLPKGMGGAPQDPQTSELYWGFLELARQVSAIQQQQAQLAHQLAALERTIASRR